MSVPSNPEAPHVGVVWVSAEVRQEGADTPIHQVKPFPIAVRGTSKTDAIKRLDELIDELKGRCG
jgi:hypothetical protein